MIYKYRDRDFTGIDGHMFVHNGITEENAPFYVEDLSGQANTLTIGKTSGVPTIVVEKSSNGINWESMEVVNNKFTATVPANGRLYLRCSTTAWNGHKIYLTGEYEVGGNIMSLLYGKKYTGKETSFPSTTGGEFSSLFAASPIVYASNLKLPALSLNTLSYYGMFYGCRRLITPPELPATSLAGGCYTYMFYSCLALTTAPNLPAITMFQNCYSHMFYSCIALTAAPNLPAIALAQGCYSYMFDNCRAMTTVPTTLPATTLAPDCYEGMFGYCELLATAPILPATKLVDNCYGNMFKDCTNLNYIKCLADVKGDTTNTSSWCSGVSATGTFVKNSSTYWTRGESGTPTGWTIQNA